MTREHKNKYYQFGKWIPSLFISCDSEEERELEYKRYHNKYKGIFQKRFPYKNIEGRILYTFTISNVSPRNSG